MMHDADRSDVLAKVTGEAKFTGDLRLPGMLHAAVVRSSQPHARLDFVDVATAMNGVGVVDIVVAEDLAELDAMYGNIVRDRPILASGRVRFEGEPIAIVVADTLPNARAAAAAVHVGYSELPVVATVEDALRGDTVLHDRRALPGGISGIAVDDDLARNVCHRHVRVRGDVDTLPEDALVIEGTYTFPAVYQYAMEPHTALADHTGAELEVWASSQHPYAVRRELARIFGMDLAAVRVAVPYIGGGFGSKSWTRIEPLAAVASWRVRAPVRLALEVREAMRTSRRHNATVEVRTAFAPTGEILSRRVRAVFDTGAYTDNGPQVVETSLDAAVAPYHVPAYDLESVAVFTNTPPAGSMRAIGTPQVNWGCELQMDRAARTLGIDPMEIRRRNLAPRGAMVFDGLRPVDAELKDSLDTLERLVRPLPAGDGAAAEAGGSAASGSRVRGRGMAVSMSGAGGSSVSVAWLRLHADGSLTLHVGATEMGQGSQVALTSIAARALGVPPERVRLVSSDSRDAPYDQSTGASRTTTVGGRAVQAAADDLVAQLRRAAARMADVEEDAVTFRDGLVTWDGGSADLPTIVRYLFGSPAGELVGVGYTGPRIGSAEPFSHPIFWEIAAGVVDVDIDVETGEVRVLRYGGVSDVGAAIHERSLRGQEQGAIVMGLGHTLSEDLRFDAGVLRNESLADYRVPTLLSMPVEFVVGHVENQDGPGPFGARGAGEGGVVPVAGAVANAVRDALGVEPDRLPLTSETVWRLAAQRRRDLSDRDGS
jgi:CO/xanthine dehydrogenase Mo-binding subunit